MFKEQVARCWKKPAGGLHTKDFFMEVEIKLKRDGSLEAIPTSLSSPQNEFLQDPMTV